MAGRELPTTPQTAASVDETTPTRRRSPRVAELANAPPTLQQIVRMEVEEQFTRRVSPRVAGARDVVSPRRRRTRAMAETDRAAQARTRHRLSPHVENVASAGDAELGGEAADESDEEQEEEDSDDDEQDNGDNGHDNEESNSDGDEEDEQDDEGSGTDDCEQGASKVPLVQMSVEPVPAPPLQEFHDGWEEWLLYELKYSDDTCQALSIKYTTNAATRNSKIALMMKKPPLIPDDLSPYERIYICTHGSHGKSKSTGARPYRFIRFTGCPMKFTVQWVFHMTLGWRLQVKPRVMWHNHKVNAQVYQTYPVSRGVKDPETEQRAREMVADGVGRGRIYSFFLDRGENVYEVDVDNFINENRGRISNEDDNTATAIVLARLANQDRKSVISVDETDKKETGVISFSTAHMRTMFQRFGELLLVDCTHNTNRCRYQLCTFMVMDEFGAGQVVQQSLFETNADWHMEKALAHLRRANPDSWSRVRVIVVDKDLNEIRVLKRCFVDAQILICHFHVKKYLAKISRKPEFSKISSEDHAAIDHTVHNLIYAETEDDYDNRKLAFMLTCDRIGSSEFNAYMEKNWFSCPEMWAVCQRAKLPHFSNHTNNRLENWFGKFKQEVPDNASMSECVSKLIENGRRCKRDYEFNLTRPGQYYNAQYSTEMKEVLRASTPYVAKAVEPQYTASRNKFDKYQYEESVDDNFVIVKGRRADHVVDTSDWSCDCKFSKNMLLPCRHAMAFRRHKGYAETIPLQRIDIRWKRAATAPPDVRQFLLNEARRPTSQLNEANNPTTPTAPADPSSVRDNSARYNDAMRQLIPICSELAEIDDEEEFQSYIDFLKDQFRNVRKRKRTGVVRDYQPEQSPSSASQPVQVELSQANSLWSDEVGDVPTPSLGTLRIQRPTELIIDDGITPIVDQTMSEHGGDMVGHGEDMDEDMEPHSSAEAHPELYDAHVEEEDTKVSAKSIRVALNENAAKSGRPKLDKKAVAAAQRQERVVFNETEKARKKYGELTLGDVADALDTEKPSPAETRKRLAGVKVAHPEALNKKIALKTTPNPTLNQNAYYVLPRKVLKACVKLLPVSTRPGEVIAVGTPDAAAAASKTTGARRRSPRTTAQAAGSSSSDHVHITSVGSYSRRQIEFMLRISNLQKAARNGEEFATWIRNVLSSSVCGDLQPVASKLADDIERLYPFGQLPDLPQASEFKVAALYRLKAPKWFGDGLITAFCERLQQAHKHVRYVSPVQTKSTGRPKIQPSVQTRLKQLAAEVGVTTILLPVNFGDWHWTSIHIDVPRKTINFYDAKDMCFGALEHLAISLCSATSTDAAFPGFRQVKISNPFQEDGFSCGLFVCFKFWRYVDKTISTNMDPGGLFTRRLELLHFVLRGTKVPSFETTTSK